MPFNHRAFLKHVPTLPGVYRMYDQQGAVLYIGKAKNLKRRLASYFRQSNATPNHKREQLISQLFAIKCTITQHENEALILENNLIKAYKPKFNILLKDNKSYPSLWMSNDPFPRLIIHRGPKPPSGQLFGPYPNASSIKNTLSLLQKIFKIRHCDNLFFNHRTRPCLQHQIGRCSAPCVGSIAQQNYHESITGAVLFLQGKSETLTNLLTTKMATASKQRAYEKAAIYRDQMAQLRSIQIKQSAMTHHGHIDIIAATIQADTLFVEILVVRDGNILGHHSYQSKAHHQSTLEEALWAFLPQYYLSSHLPTPYPTTIYTHVKLSQAAWLATTIKSQWKHDVKISLARQTQAKRWMDIALTNLNDHLNRTTKHASLWEKRCQALQPLLSLTTVPSHIICFDVSHHAGEATRASCVACGPNGLIKHAYRLFNIKQITAGDDYSALGQALTKYIESNDKDPDLIVLDGGKGQLSVALTVLENRPGPHPPLIGIAKGAGRKRGAEKIFVANQKAPIEYHQGHPGVQLLLNIRDEAHRFAIKGHRQNKRKARKRSILENIPGIGALKRQALLAYFGGLQALQKASIEQINQVPGVHKILAQRIYAALHGDLPGNNLNNPPA